MARASFMTREQAIEKLRECGECKRWITTAECDHCWVDRHRCPPTVAKAKRTLQEAIEVGQQARLIMTKIQRIEA